MQERNSKPLQLSAWLSKKLLSKFMKESLEKYFEENRERFLEELKAFLKFESISTEIDNELEELTSSLYINGLSDDSIAYPVRYLKVFARPIEKLEAIDLRDQLSPIPTLIFQSEITDEKIFFCVTYPKPFEPIDNSSSHYQTTLPFWHWKSIKITLNHLGYSEEDSLTNVKELIILVHKVVIMYFSDLYLLSLDPYYTPKLFDFLDESSDSSILNQWIKPFRDSLLDFQRYVQDRALRQAQENQGQRFFEDEDTYASSATIIDFENLQWLPITVFCFSVMIFLGFCSQQYQQSSPVIVRPPNEIPYEPEKYGTVQITNPTFNSVADLWTEPNGNKKVGQLQQGNRIIILAISNDTQWYRVQSQDGQKGWIYNEMVILEP